MSAAATVNVREARCEREPEIPFTVIGYDPAGVDREVEKVKVDVQLGLQDEAEKPAVAPDGSPEAERDTDWLVPEIRPTVTGYERTWPAVTVPLPARETEKSKVDEDGGVTAAAVVNVKLSDVARLPAAFRDLTR